MCVQVEAETASSELELSKATGRLIQLEREVGHLRQNDLEVNRLTETAEYVTEQAKLEAEEAQQVSHTHSAQTPTSGNTLPSICVLGEGGPPRIKHANGFDLSSPTCLCAGV